MIIVQTPLRISFIGGGSDISDFHMHSAGATLSMTINKYIYVCVNANFHQNVRVSYSKTETVDHVHLLEHTRVRESMKLLGIHSGIEVITLADIPSQGTGLGSSSSLTVGLLKALHQYKGVKVSEKQVAEEACKIEIEILKEPIGKQDQFIASFGGFRFMQYMPNNSVIIDDVIIKPEVIRRIEDSILLFYTGITRDTGAILRKQVEGLREPVRFENTKKMVQMAHQLRRELEQGAINNLGEMLHEGWQLKKSLSSGISNIEIDYMYELARKHGAEGGKLLGAGGGGFLMIYAPIEKHEAIREALKVYKVMNIKFDPQGSRLVSINNNI